MDQFTYFSKQTRLIFALALFSSNCLAQQKLDDYVLVKRGWYPFSEKNIPVQISAFYISKAEVSYAEMEAFSKANHQSPALFHDPKFGEPDPARAALKVTWFDAIRYANWLSEQRGLEKVYLIFTKGHILANPLDSLYWEDKAWESITYQPLKKGYRLPTEVEWEYTASGYAALYKGENEAEVEMGTDTLGEINTGIKQKYAGTDLEENLTFHAIYASNSKESVKAVKTLDPNPLGLYDMSGNVWEWCYDVFEADNPERFRNQKDPCNQSTSQPLYKALRSLRGGSYLGDHKVCMVENAFYGVADQNYSGIGFRLCRSF